MVASRARVSLLSLLATTVVALAVHGQAPASTGFTLIENLGLPAVDAGALVGEPRASNLTAGEFHGALGAARASAGRLGTASGLAYMRGKVIVKCRGGASGAFHAESLRSVSQTAVVSARPAYADFDVVAIDPREDAEAVATLLRERDDVEYAQAAYVMHPMLVPNDPLYKQLQWNLPLIDIGRGWDIQPKPGESIIVGVIDTGVAFMNATIRTNIFGFRDETGALYPPILNATIPYSAAPQLVTDGRFVAPHDFANNTSTPLDFEGHGTHVSGTIGQLTNDGVGTAEAAVYRAHMPVSVAAVDLSKNHARYSSSGSWVELAAPGGGGGNDDLGYVWQQTFHPDLVNTFDLPVAQYHAPRFDVMAYVGEAGTSMAAPHVAGLAAMLMQQGITDPAAVEDALEKSAIDLGARGRDDLFGFGLIDARNALFGKGTAK